MQSEYINISTFQWSSSFATSTSVTWLWLESRGETSISSGHGSYVSDSLISHLQPQRKDTECPELDWSCIAPEAEISRLPPTSRDDGFCFRLAVTQPSDSDTDFPPLTLPTRLLWVLPCIPSAVVCLCSLTPMLHHLLFHRAWFSFHVKTSLAGGCRCGVIGSGDQFT